MYCKERSLKFWLEKQNNNLRRKIRKEMSIFFLFSLETRWEQYSENKILEIARYFISSLFNNKTNAQFHLFVQPHVLPYACPSFSSVCLSERFFLNLIFLANIQDRFSNFC